MAFGQQSGPPAGQRAVQQLLELLRDAGHSDFREARGPMGFTQRQAAGKFTREEAAAFIEQLQAVADGPRPGGAVDDALRGVSDDRLAAELQRRGWVVMAP